MRSPRLSSILLLAMLSTGCSKWFSSSDQAAASSSPTRSADPSTVAPQTIKTEPAISVRDRDGKLTKAGWEAEWKRVYFSSAAATASEEKKRGDFVSAVGAPASH